jgi:hypothetical protein
MRLFAEPADVLAVDWLGHRVRLVAEVAQLILAWVMSSMIPARRMSSAVSSIALTMRRGLVAFAIAHLLQNLLGEGMRNLSCVCRQPSGPDLAPPQQLVGADVLALTLSGTGRTRATPVASVKPRAPHQRAGREIAVIVV